MGLTSFDDGGVVKKASVRIGVITLAVGVLVLVIMSPIALQQFTRLRVKNWMLLSNIGQTYGAVSALFAALALGGIVISLLYQARANRTAREQAARTFHHELLKMEMENPLYMKVLSYPPGDYREKADYDSLRQYDYVHMWVSYWSGLYELRELQDNYLRFIAANELFTGIIGRQYWSAVGSVQLETNRGRRLKFAQILDEEYQKAIAGGPPTTVSFANNSRKENATSRLMRPDKESKVLACAAVVGGILAGGMIGRQLTRRR